MSAIYAPRTKTNMTPIKKHTATVSDSALQRLGCAAMIFALLAGIALVVYVAK